MGRNMKKSKQNVVSKVKDFKKQKVKVGRKLKNIAETLPKVKVAKINLRSQFTDDLPYNTAGLLLDDKTEATQELSPLALNSLQQLSEQLLAQLKQTHTGKKMDTRRDSLTHIHNLLLTSHPHLSSANLMELLETLCSLMVDPETAIRVSASRVLRVVLSKVVKSEGLSEDEGLDWDSNNFAILLAYTLRAMSISNYSSTSLLNLQLIFDLCPLLAFSSSFRISQSLLKMLLNQNSGILSKNKNKQILSLEGDGWSSVETASHTVSLYTRLSLIKSVTSFYELMLQGNKGERLSNDYYPDNIINDQDNCTHFAADIIKIMTDVFIDEFYKARKKEQSVKKASNYVAVLVTEEVLDVMLSCIKCIHHSILFIHRLCSPSAISCGHITDNINTISNYFPFTISMASYRGNRKSKKINSNDIGNDLNNDVVAVILLFIQHPSIHQSLPNASVLSHNCKRFHRFDYLCYKVIKFMSTNLLSSLPYIIPFYRTLVRHHVDDKRGICCEYLVKQDKNEFKKKKTEKIFSKTDDKVNQLGSMVIEYGSTNILYFLNNIDAMSGEKKTGSMPGDDGDLQSRTSNRSIKFPYKEVVFCIRLFSQLIEKFDSNFVAEIKLATLKYFILSFEAMKNKGRVDMKNDDLSFLLKQLAVFIKSANNSEDFCDYLVSNVHKMASYWDLVKALPANHQKFFIYLLSSSYKTFFDFHNENNNDEDGVSDDNGTLLSLMTQASNEILATNSNLLFLFFSSLIDSGGLEGDNIERWERLICIELTSHFIAFIKETSDVYDSKLLNVFSTAMANLLINSQDSLIIMKSFISDFTAAVDICTDSKHKIFIVMCYIFICITGIYVVEEGDEDGFFAGDMVEMFNRFNEVSQQFCSVSEVLHVLKRLIMVLFTNITKYKIQNKQTTMKNSIVNTDNIVDNLSQVSNAFDYENVRELLKRRFHNWFSDFQIQNLTRVFLAK